MASTASLPAYLLPGVPVHQPSHLEGNPSLATEILPGPPPVVTAQQATQKRDPKKPSISFSYLPPSDPGSTYSGLMHGTLVGQELTVEASRSKRARLDKSSTTGRAQRASARQHNSAPPVHTDSDQSVPNVWGLGDTENADSVIAEDDFTPSHSNSTPNVPDPGNLGRLKRKDKGKGKEVESTQVRVKEEPKVVSLLTPEPSSSALNSNDDHCSSCRSQGALVYCDGCPRAFHLWCLDPPVEQIDEGDSRWFCPSCMIKKHPPRRPPPSLLSPLILHLENTIPTEFQLPDDVRSFFRDVATGPKGAYVDASELKQPRLNRHGQLEDRDVYRVRDRNGTPVLCYRCGTSALPSGVAATTTSSKRPRRASVKIPTDGWKGVISCDFCSLHWHLDCLDPPLSSMPPFNRKWMCPNHAEQILPSKRRIPKQNAPPVEITRPKQFNNGNIEVTHPEAAGLPLSNQRFVVDEVLINGRRYRVPERVIVFDFWNKINQLARGPVIDNDASSGLSSPLTSLTSLEDLEQRNLDERKISSHDSETYKVAQMLCNLRIPQDYSIPSPTGQTKAAEDHPESQKSIDALNSKNYSSRPNAPPKAIVTSAAPSASRTTGSAKRKRAAHNVSTEPSTRELRSRSKNLDYSSLTSVSSRSSLRRGDESSQDRLLNDHAHPRLQIVSPAQSKPFTIKVEETELDLSVRDDNQPDILKVSITKRGRPPRRSTAKDIDGMKRSDRRGRKRKEREDDDDKDQAFILPAVASKHPDKKEKVEKKTRQHQNSHLTAPSNVLHPNTPTVSAAPAPSLKIRLPRLSSLQAVIGGTTKHGSSFTSTAIDTPSRF